MNQIVEDYRKKNTPSPARNFLNNLSVGKIIILAVIILILIAVGKTANTKYSYVIYGVLILVIIFLAFKQSNKLILLNLETAKLVAQDYLERMRVAGKEISFDSKIEVMPVGQMCYKDDMVSGDSGAVSINIGFIEYVHGSQFKKEGVISIHPYDGTITGMQWMNLGYTGNELTTHTKIIPVGVINNNIQGGTNPQDYKPS